MKKRLPKATQSTFSEIHGESTETGAENTEADVVEILEPEVETAREAVIAPVPLASRPGAADNELRHTRALVIVERYTTYSALGGCIPLAIFDSLSVGVIVFNMVRALAEHYRVPFQRDRVKAGVAALSAGVASPTLGNLAGNLATRLIPGAWLVSTAVSSATAAGLTRYIGQAFIDHLESGGTALDFNWARGTSYLRKPATA